MPRGQDPNSVQGGTLSPYVQQSLQQGKQQAENRLLSATQEAGATSRAQMQEAGATGRQAMQIQGQQAMQAAELEAQDKRSAEAERARREDQQYQKMLQDDQQSFLAERSKIEQEFVQARDERNFEREDVALEREKDLLTLKHRWDAQIARNRNKVILGIANLSQQKETMRQRMITTQTEGAEKAEKEIKAHEISRDRTAELMRQDKRLDTPIASMVPGLPSAMVGFGGAIQIPGRKPVATPLGVVQDQMRANGSNISIGDLLPVDTPELVKQIGEGKITETQVQAAASTLDGAVIHFTERLENAGNKKEADFWHRQIDDVTKARLRLSQAVDNTTKLAGNETRTVGSLVRDALGSVDGNSDGSRIAKMKADYASTVEASEASLQELTASLDAFESLPSGENDSPFLLDMTTRMNSRRGSASGAPSFGGAITGMGD